MNNFNIWSTGQYRLGVGDSGCNMNNPKAQKKFLIRDH